MTAQAYILATLKSLAEPIQPEDIGATPLEDAILAKVMSKKFRKVHADEETVRVGTRHIVEHLDRDVFRIKVEPSSGWIDAGNGLHPPQKVSDSEKFCPVNLWCFVKSPQFIAAKQETHRHRLVVFDGCVYRVLGEAEQYSVGFRAMLQWLEQYIPQGVSVTYRRYAEEYPNYEAYLEELEVAKKRVLEANGGKLPELSEQQKAATELNVRTIPGQTDDPLWREKTEVIHRALEDTDTMHRYFDDPTLVMACPTTYSGWVAVGSTKRSYAKFWAAVGVLERAGEHFNELVLTPKQLEAAKFEWEPVKLEGLVGKNFSKIRVLQ